MCSLCAAAHPVKANGEQPTYRMMESGRVRETSAISASSVVAELFIPPRLTGAYMSAIAIVPAVRWSLCARNILARIAAARSVSGEVALTLPLRRPAF